MGCTPFVVGVSGPPEKLFPVARNAIIARGGTVRGDHYGGSASVETPVGRVVFDYAMAPQGVEITVVDKPFVLSCARIEQELRTAITQATPPPTIPTTVTPVIVDAVEPNDHELSAARKLYAYLSGPGASFGTKTYPSPQVAAFQEAVGLDSDGIVGRDVREAALSVGVRLPPRPSTMQPPTPVQRPAAVLWPLVALVGLAAVVTLTTTRRR